MITRARKSKQNSQTVAKAQSRVPRQQRKRDHVEISFEEEISTKIANKGKVQESAIVTKKKKTQIIITNPHKERDNKEPPNWKEVYDGISKMRSAQVAPVDQMGCEMLADEKETPETMRYQTLISLMLSSQTKDQVTAAAMANLKEHGLTVENILKTDETKLDELINKVGFHKRKSKYIKQATEIIKTQYNGDIPSTIEGLVELPGVGPKMAMLTMQVAWNKSIGIGVDVHVHRISNRLGWVKKTKNPEETRKVTRLFLLANFYWVYLIISEELEGWLPFEYWNKVNKLLVGFGQTICSPVGPKCDQCTVSDFCPSAFKK